MPDNINLSDPPKDNARPVMPKLCVYVRAIFDPKDEAKSVSMTMHMPDGNDIEVGSVGPTIISKAFEDARKKGMPLATIVMRVEFQPFPIVALGSVIAEMNIDGRKSIAAQVNLTHGEAIEGPFEEVTQVTKTLPLKPISSPTS